MAAEHTILSADNAVTDATFFVQVRGHHIDLGIEYSSSVLDEDLAGLLLRDLDTVIRTAIDDPATLVGDIALPSIVPQLHGDEPLFSADEALTRTIVAHGVDRPDDIAVRFAGTSITYGELDSRSGQLAARLVSAGAGPGRFVAVEAVRHSDVVVAILGILRSGAAYVPIVPTYPRSHIDHVFANADIELLVTVNGSAGPIAADDVSTIEVGPYQPQPQAKAKESSEYPVGVDVSLDDPAYVIFTSGSTGEPKGVVVSHGNLAHSTIARTQAYTSTVGRFLLLSSFAFDSSMVGLFWTLYVGGTVVIPEPGQQQDVWGLGELIKRERVTHMLALPSLYQLIVTENEPGLLNSLETVIVAGEACPPTVVSSHGQAELEADLYNEYGPTEATVWSHFHRIEPTATDPHQAVPIGDVVPIGKAIPGVTATVVDRDDQPLPVGVPGELMLGGPTITAGYHRDPDLTRERFVHLDVGLDTTQKWYRTGDLAEFRANGDLLFRGRTDDQVKIRGFRVELGDIEVVALSIDKVTAAFAGVVQSGPEETGQKRLALWYLDDGSLEPAELRDRLWSRLAEHMVPAVYRRIDHVPLTPNGKLDKDALPMPEPLGTESRPDTEAETSEELALVAVWTDVLQLESVAVGTGDNFFDLGGDSIISIQVVARLRKLGYSLTPRDVFEHQTIADLAIVMGRVTTVDTDQGLVTGQMPLTPIQSWFFEQELTEPNHWNQSLWLPLDPTTDLDVLETAAQYLATQHDALRLRFEHSPAGWTQVHAEKSPNIRFVRHGDPTSASGSLTDEARTQAAEELDASLDIATGELVAVAAFVSAGALELYVTIHHLVIDAVSWSPLLEDWSTAYQQLRTGRDVKLEPKTTSFRAWSNALASRASEPHAAKYWRSQQPPDPTPLVPDNSQGRAHRSSAIADESVTAALLRGRSAQTVLLAATAVAVGELNSCTEVDVMLEGHGREVDLFTGVDLSRTVGWFTTRFPIRLPSSDPAGSTGVLRQVSSLLDEIPDRGIGYGIARAIAHDDELRARPEPSLAFNYLGQLDRSLPVSPPFIEAGPLSGAIAADNRRDHTLGVIAYVKSGRLTVELEYLDGHLRAEIAEALVARMVDVVRELTELGSHDQVDPTRFELSGLDPAQLSQLGELIGRLDAEE